MSEDQKIPDRNHALNVVAADLSKLYGWLMHSTRFGAAHEALAVVERRLGLPVGKDPVPSSTNGRPAQPVAPAPAVLAELAGEMREVEASYRVLSSDGHEGMDGLAEAWAAAADMVERQATSGARAAGGETEALDRAARKMHEFSEMRGLTWERANASRKHKHWHDVMRERAQAVIDEYGAAPPTPSAPGVAALLKECARRQAGTGEYAFISCDQIVRLLAPEGADGTEAGT